MTVNIQPPLIVHIIYRLGVGGLENGLVNLINKIPVENYRHAIISLTDSTDFCRRIKRQDCEIFEIQKQPGQDWRSFIKVYRLLKKLKPVIVHTRNLSAIEYQICAFFASIPLRVHGEHGWGAFDSDGKVFKYQLLRRVMAKFIHCFIPLSLQIQDYLVNSVGIDPKKITRICNGVDTDVFYPRKDAKIQPEACPLQLEGKLVLGTIGRMHDVKDQITLVKAFIDACKVSLKFAENCRLFLIGDGPLRLEAQALLAENQLLDKAWLPGERNDIPEILRFLDIFILPSKSEGISNAILEAMASGLPVIATRVGGNPELVFDESKGRDQTGYLVNKEDVVAMSEAMRNLAENAEKREQLGEAAFRHVNDVLSINNMVIRYLQVYDNR
jgi:sugar transferase (PEP-CTERM/EpsH1 system associated)